MAFTKSASATVGVQAGQDMNVVFHAADAVEVALLVLGDAPDVAKQIVATGLRQNAFAMLRREDDVVDDLGVGGHGRLAVQFNPCGVASHSFDYRGFHPRLFMFGPSGARALFIRSTF